MWGRDDQKGGGNDRLDGNQRCEKQPVPVFKATKSEKGMWIAPNT